MKFIARIIALMALIIAPPLAAQDFPARGTAPVVDAANIIDDATEARLTQQLDEFEQRTQRQFVIATIPDLQGYDIADYGYQLGRTWALGDKGRNDGIILIVAPNDRKMRIEVGYGLEGTLPDGLAFEYVEGMKPYFRNNDYSGGIEWGAQQVMRQLELPPEEAAAVAKASAAKQDGEEGGFPVGMVIWILFILFFFILPALRGGRRYRSRGADAVGDIILWEAGKAIARGISDGGDWGGGGGGWGGGGGFSGGGGSFGGGGASGGW